MYEAGRFAEAESLFDRGYREAVRRGDRHSEFRFLNNLAGTGYATFRFRSAIARYLEARGVADSLDDPELVAIASHNLASLYNHMNAPELALEAAGHGLRVIEGTGLETDRGRLLIQVMQAWALQARPDQVLALFEQAYDALDTKANTVGQALCWQMLGIAYWRRGDFDRADRAYSEALRLQTPGPDPYLANTLLNLARLRISQRDHRSALFLIRSAEREQKKSAIRLPVWDLHWLRGAALDGMGRLREALKEFRQALDHTHRWRLEIVPAEAFRTKSESYTHRIYSSFVEAAGELYLRTGDTRLAREAFEVAQRNRAAAWNRAVDENGERAPNLPERYFDLLALVRMQEASLLMADRAATRQTLARLRTEMAEIEASAALGTPASTLGPGQEQRAIHPSEALIAFHLGERRSWIWELTSDSFTMRPLGPKSAVEAAAARVRTAVEAGGEPAIQAGSRFYQELFSAASQLTLKRRRWVLAPDRSLFQVPWAALVTGTRGGRPEYLIQQRTIEIVPAHLYSRRRTAGDPGFGLAFVGVGDPVYNAADPRWHGSREVGSARVIDLFPGMKVHAANSLELPRLAGSSREVEACARMWAPGQARLLTGTNATLAALRAELNRSGAIAHLATHVLPSASHPGQALVALCLRRAGEPELVTASDIAALEIRAPVVVLSGCGSGVSETAAGIGLIGLTRAWLMAGAGSVVATLWQTSDDSGEFFQEFYRQFLTNSKVPLLSGSTRQAPHTPFSGKRARMDAAEALRHAQLHALSSRTWRSQPRHWAAYFAVGKD